MVGFMSPGLGFSSTIGAAIGGAARQASTNMEAEQGQERQDDAIWAAKFAQGEQNYQKYKKDYAQKNFMYGQLFNAAGKNTQLADQAMTQVLADPKSFNSVYNDLVTRAPKNSTPGDLSQSEYMKSLNSGLTEGYNYLSTIRAGARPQAQRFMNMPEAPNYGNPQGNIQGQFSGQDQQPFTFSGPNKLASKELLKPENFNSPDAYRAYIASMNKDPNNPDLSGVTITKQGSKLDPMIQSQILEYNKLLPNMSPEDRKTFSDSITEARNTGDASKIRSDLLPTQEQMNAKKAQEAGATEGAKDYAKALQKRQDNMYVVRKSEIAADQMLDKISSGQLHAGMWQPFIDQVNRAAGEANIDLKGKLGLRANTITDTNEFRKFLADLTFDQIPNYHLGRWTNREFMLLKESLPSLDTDPSTMAKVGLLFKNAAVRERESFAEEHRIAYGQNGEKFFSPDLGRAAAYGADRLTSEESLVPWKELPRNPQEAQQFMQTLKPGEWFEDPYTHTMGVASGNGQFRTMKKS